MASRIAGRAGLKKVVKTVRTKKGTKRQTFWVRAGAKLKTGAKVAAGVAALAGAAYLAHKGGVFRGIKHGTQAALSARRETIDMARSRGQKLTIGQHISTAAHATAHGAREAGGVIKHTTAARVADTRDAAARHIDRAAEAAYTRGDTQHAQRMTRAQGVVGGIRNMFGGVSRSAEAVQGKWYGRGATLRRAANWVRSRD